MIFVIISFSIFTKHKHKHIFYPTCNILLQFLLRSENEWHNCNCEAMYEPKVGLLFQLLEYVTMLHNFTRKTPGLYVTVV